MLDVCHITEFVDSMPVYDAVLNMLLPLLRIISVLE